MLFRSLLPLIRERREMPDIDMDFADDKREEVIKYCIDHYGRDHVAQIITFGTLGAKAAIRDTAREIAFGLGIKPELIRRASETIIGCCSCSIT